MNRIKDKIVEFFTQRIPHTVIVTLVFLFIIPAICLGFWFGYKYITELSSQIDKLSETIENIESDFISRTISLEKDLEKTRTSLRQALNQETQNVSQRISKFKDEFGDVTEKVTNLEKLSKIDEELLKKYSKVYFLNENYEPSGLIEIPDKYKYYENRSYQIHNIVWPYLKTMLDTAKNAELEIYVYSSYRSFDSQENIKDNYEIIYGQESANQFSADQGYSEHQLGTTVDLITTGINGTLDGFGNTEEYKWLTDNAHKFGFTLSYPKDNKYYIYEPWHWRFIGIKLATYLKNNNKHFYDLDQRQIDQYLISIFD